MFSSGTRSNTSKVTQAIRFRSPCSSLWGEPNLGTFGTLSLKRLCNLNCHTNAKLPSAVSVLRGADPLSSESSRNLWRLLYCQVMKSQKEEIRNQKGKPEWLCGVVTVQGRSKVRQLFLFGKLICFSCKVDSYHLHKASPRAISRVPLLPALQPSFGAGREGVKCCSLAEEGPQLHARSAWGARAGTAVPSEGIPSHVKLICSSKRAWLNSVCVEVGVCADLG